MRYSALAAILPVSVLFVGQVSGQLGPESVARGTKRFRATELLSGLAGPWELTWGPDNMLWVTERTGKRVTRVDPATGERKVAVTLEDVFAPGGQDGLLGMALHPELLKGSGNDYVFVSHTYVDKDAGPDLSAAGRKNPYRYLYMKIVRLTYNPENGTLSSPVSIVTGLPAGNDHNAGRLKIGPDRKLYLTIGDQGHDQLGNYCLPIESQRLPTQQEVEAKRYGSYVGKSLRFNLDGSVPSDNPMLAGVVSHVYTYGHRNPQGLDFGPDGTLYSSEHGPKTDDEINILKRGSNYGWPHVVGLRDGNAYEYARWADATKPCAQLRFNDLQIHPSVPREPESAFTMPLVEPIATMFTVPSSFNFQDPACRGVYFICWPTVGASSIEYYGPKAGGIPGWDGVLLVTTLKRGSLYVLPLSADRQSAAGPMSRYFQSENRYRDTAVSPDGRTIYVATDPGGLVEASSGGATASMKNKGAILAFTYLGEGGPAPDDEPRRVSEVAQPEGEVKTGADARRAAGPPPQFTARQVAAGRIAYNANCAVCHGSTMTNGTLGTPLAGEYFKNKWFGRTVGALYDHARTMPPASRGSLSNATYANIVAYIFEVNGFKPGAAPLATVREALERMTIQ